jgi:branched-subunit amino acid aminotransferase/4-amino-4-deoxychorismate lyase
MSQSIASAAHGQIWFLNRSGGMSEAGGTACTAPRSTLLVADSWLVADGRVRALDRHQRRFTRSCAELAGLPERLLSTFWSAMVEVLPHERGLWFPRVELVGAASDAQSPDAADLGGYQLLLRLRKAPTLGAQARVWATAVPDPRDTPRHKGPDLEALASVRRAAATAGSDEAVLVTAEGVLLEAANSSLLWWEGDCLCCTSEALPVLPGVTAGLVLDRAAELGIAVRPCVRRLPDLAGCEVWLTNALHGLRPVTAWVGAPMPVGEPVRAPSWRSWLDELAEPFSS